MSEWPGLEGWIMVGWVAAIVLYRIAIKRGFPWKRP
jgi:hypothetical protein